MKTSAILILFIFSALVVVPGYNRNEEEKKTEILKEGNFTVYHIDKNEMNFGVSMGKPTGKDFYINSNFFDKSGNPIGLVVIEEERKSKRISNKGGFFYVKNGKAKISSNTCPTKTEFSSQTILWAIDDGKINRDLLKTSHGKKEAYRSLMGENEEGNIIIIASKRTGLVTIEEIVDYAVSIGIVEGILLDGGTSVEYKFTGSKSTREFSAIPEFLRGVFEKNNPPVYIWGNFK